MSSWVRQLGESGQMVSEKVKWAWSDVYDSFSVEPMIWVRRGHESESGQMVLKKVKVTYFDAYLW